MILSGLKHWLQTHCQSYAVDNKPTCISHDFIHMGNSTTHVSHDMRTYRGLVYCRKCGARGSGDVGLRLLSHPCSPPSNYGLLSLRSIRDGKLPPNLLYWPDEVRNIDRAHTSTKRSSESFIGLRIKRPRLSSHSSKEASGDVASCPSSVRAPRASKSSSLPTVAQIRGVKISAYPELPPDLSNLQDLIELETIGEKVIWPIGLDAKSASTLISDWLSGRTHREDNSAAL